MNRFNFFKKTTEYRSHHLLASSDEFSLTRFIGFAFPSLVNDMCPENTTAVAFPQVHTAGPRFQRERHIYSHRTFYPQCFKRAAEKRKQLPFDEEHQLALPVSGADDAFRLRVAAAFAVGVWALLVWLGDDAIAWGPGLHAGFQHSGTNHRDEFTSFFKLKNGCRFHNI